MHAPSPPKLPDVSYIVDLGKNMSIRPTNAKKCVIYVEEGGQGQSQIQHEGETRSPEPPAEAHEAAAAESPRARKLKSGGSGSSRESLSREDESTSSFTRDAAAVAPLSPDRAVASSETGPHLKLPQIPSTPHNVTGGGGDSASAQTPVWGEAGTHAAAAAPASARAPSAARAPAPAAALSAAEKQALLDAQQAAVEREKRLAAEKLADEIEFEKLLAESQALRFSKALSRHVNDAITGRGSRLSHHAHFGGRSREERHARFQAKVEARAAAARYKASLTAKPKSEVQACHASHAMPHTRCLTPYFHSHT